MSEHLQFTPISPGNSPLVSQAAGGEKTGLPSLLDVFAALLDGHAVGAKVATGSGPTVAETGLTYLGGPAAEPEMTGEAAADPQTLLADLADALVALDTALQSGQQPDPALLARVDETVDALAELLGVAQDDKPQLVESLGAIAGLAVTVFAPALAPIVAAAVPVIGGAIEAATPDATPQPLLAGAAEKIADIAERLEPANASLAAKLAALGETLGAGRVGPDLVAKLGLTADAAPDARLEASLQALVAEKPPVPQVVAAQAFGSPALALPEGTVLAARKAGDVLAQPIPLDIEAEGEAAIGRTAAPQRPSADNGQGAPAPLAPLAAAANVETSADPAATTQTGTSSVQLLPAATTHAGIKAQHAAYQTPQLNLPQLAFEMVRQIQGGNSRFQIRLDPPELGRIDVRMDVDAGGNLNARLTVERAETLDLLQRDQRALERALAQAGIEAGKTNLEFSLKQNPFERPQGGAFAEATPGGGGQAEPAAETAEVASVTLYRAAAAAGGVNIFV